MDSVNVPITDNAVKLLNLEESKGSQWIYEFLFITADATGAMAVLIPCPLCVV